MASLSFQADANLPQGYIKIDGSTAVTITSAGLSNAGSYSKAWVRFNGGGTTGSDLTINSSYNVSRVYKNATGDYSVVFSTPMNNTNYCCFATNSNTAGNPAPNASPSLVSAVWTPTSTLSARITNQTGTSTAYDSPMMNFVVFG